MALAGYIFSACCYGLSVGYGIRFDDRHSVPTAAALAPAVVWVGLSLPGTTRHGWLMVGPLVAVAVLVARSHRAQELVSHLLLFAATLAVFEVMEHAGLDEPLVGGLLAGMIYLAGEGLRQRASSDWTNDKRADRRTFWLLNAVVLCACGLTVLGVQEMDWPAFVAMAAVLALTKREFEAFALSRDAYAQTVSALEELKRQAGAMPSDRSP
jgi:hypothetical protein